MTDRPHLTDPELARAVVGRGEAGFEAARHLAACPACRAALAGLEQDLARLGDLARRTAPPPRRSYRPMAREAAGRPRRLRLWALAPATALAAVLLAAAVWWNPREPETRPRAATPAREELDTAALIRGAGLVSANPLSDFQRFVIGGDVPEKRLTDYLAPPLESL